MQIRRSRGGCEHCGLPLGLWPYKREINGIDQNFCCYGCYIGWEVSRGGNDETIAVGLLVRLGVGAFLAMNIMLFSLALYSQGATEINAELQQYLHYLLLAFSTPVIIILGGPFIAEALADIGKAKLGASCLISIGALAAYVYSLIVTVSGGERVYFDTATMVLCLFTLGRYLEANGRARAMRNLAPMLKPDAATVTVVVDNVEVIRPLSRVQSGDLVRFHPGDRILIDGSIVDGSGFVDESWLTGESLPIEKRIGCQTSAGTINLDGVLVVQAEREGLATQWVGICRQMHRSLTQVSAIQDLTDRVASWFVPLVLVIGLTTVGYWSQTLTFDLAMMNGLAVLVVACPCALGLAAPLATALGLEEIGNRGCLVRSGDILYQLAQTTHLAMDKTGTLTEGKSSVVRVVSNRVGSDQLIVRAAAVEAGSHHPLADGIIEFAKNAGYPSKLANQIRVIPGQGITGMLDGEQVVVGTERLFLDMQWTFLFDRGQMRLPAGREALTRVLVGWAGEVQGFVVLKDTLRVSTKTAIESIHALGIDTCIVSGDCDSAVAQIADSLGIRRWHAGLSADEKVTAIANWKGRSGKLAMVGDGINDGFALVDADVGIAVGDGVDLAQEAADVVLPHSGITPLPLIIALARRTRKTITVNLIWALAYNAVAILLAAMGQLRPEFAAALMAGSSLFVIANSIGSQKNQPNCVKQPDKFPAVYDVGLGK